MKNASEFILMLVSINIHLDEYYVNVVYSVTQNMEQVAK